MARVADHEINPIFIKRWSSRAMSGEALRTADLNRLFEAARWAPSAMNAQPWRFVYATAESADFPRFFDALMDGNKAWGGGAGALVVVISKTIHDNGRPSVSHAFDTGAAWQNLALQASEMGLVVHCMGGIHYDRAAAAVGGLSADYRVECMLAIGYPGKVEDLPEAFRAREQPSSRKPLSEFVFAGRFGQASAAE